MQLKEINKDGNRYKIKKWENSAEEGLDLPCALINDVNLPPLNLLVINFQSVLAKRTELTNLINEKQSDIIFGSETWLTPNINSTEFFPTGYTLFLRDQSDGYGGVLLAFKNNLTVVEHQIENTNSCEIIACTLRYGNQKVIVCSIYKPPSSDVTHFQELIRKL